MQWIMTYPAWTIVMLVFITSILTYFLYKNSVRKFQVGKLWIVLLSILRWLSLFLIGFLLINPLLKLTSNKTIQPIVLILEDQSASISKGMSPQEISDYRQRMDQLEKQLSTDYIVKKYPFSTGIMDSLSDTLPYSYKGTDIDLSMHQLAQKFNGQHVGAIIIASDGIYNQGLNPIYNSSFTNIPFYTIALGDTTTQTDVRIQRLRYSDIVFLGDEVQLLVDVAAENLDQKSINIELKDANGKILQSQSKSIRGNEWTETLEFKISTQAPGIHKYSVQIPGLPSEKNSLNNQQSFFIQVIDGRQKIVILYDAPHPDIKLLKEALSELKNVDLKIIQIRNLGQQLPDADLWILHGLPSLKSKEFSKTLQKITQQKSSIWWILSAQTDITALNQLQSLVQIQQVSKVPNEVTPIVERSFQKFYISDEALNELGQVPPILVPYGQYKLSTAVDVIWKQKIGKVETQQPLLISQEQQQKKVAILMGEGIWRWGMQEYYKNENKINTKESIDRIVQYIANRDDHRPFRIRTNKNIYQEGEWISLEATIYNESAQMVNQPDVQVKIVGDNGFSSQVIMDKTSQAYSYNIGKLPAGVYEVEADTRFNNKNLKAHQKFAVLEFSAEAHHTQADFSLLNTLALQHQGAMLPYQKMNQLADTIKNNDQIRPLLKEVVETKSIINFKILLLFIILFLAAEWFIRKILGQY